jgi:hypothetical protein
MGVQYFIVVPAKAETHSHRRQFCERRLRLCPIEKFRGMMVWTAPYGISVPE